MKAFCTEQVLERRVIRRRFRQQLLQAPVLILQRLQAARLRYVQPAVLRFPLVKGCAGDPLPPAHFLGLRTGLVLAQHADDLLLVEAAPFESSVSFSVDGLCLISAEFLGRTPLVESSPADFPPFRYVWS
jgi:hypothetical protein